MRQIDPDSIKTLIRRNYATANIWLGDLQVVRDGVWLGPEGEALLKKKIEAHIRWMRRHPKKVMEEVLL